MQVDPLRPFNTLPHLPPKADIESKAILKACIEARAAIAALDEAAQLLPNSGILINTIPLMEAQASSAIENIVTTQDKLFRQSELNDEGSDPATKEALRYRTALRQGFEGLRERPLSMRTAIDICRTIKGADIDVRRTPGVILRNRTTNQPIYTPPEGEMILRDLLSNWENFIHNVGDLDPLIVMAVQHYQFEAIHPFADGNGRTGRILNVLLLVEKKLLQLPILYLSSEILKQRDRYYSALNDVTQSGEWELWIRWMINVTALSAETLRNRILAIRILIEMSKQEMRQRVPKIYSRDLLDIVFRHPYCRIDNIARAVLVRRQAASSYLRQLCAIGILEEHRSGREKLYVNRRLLQVLNSDPPDFDLFTKDPSGEFRRFKDSNRPTASR